MKKVVILSLISLVCLALLGVGYAHWMKTLSINGTIKTGKVDWELTDFQILDNIAPPIPVPDYNCRDGFAGPPRRFWQVDKNVGWAEGELVGTDGDGDKDTLELALNNVYPSYFNSVSVDARNNGTIPIKIDRVVIDGIVLRKSPTPVVKLNLTGDEKPDIEIWWRDGFGTQLEPGDNSVDMNFWFHVLQDAPQGAGLHFTIKIEAIQWNMYTAP